MSQNQANGFSNFDREGAIFMAAQRETNGCKVGLFGVPYDGTTSFRPGTRFGPAAIREVSNGLETYCPELNLDLEELKFVDLGSLNIPFGDPRLIFQNIRNATKKLIDLDLKPLMLGGEHSITPGAISAITEKHPDLALIQLDAHADLRNEWLGSQYNHACAMRRCLEVLPSKKLLQLDIRSGTREEFKELKASNRLISSSNNQRKELSEALTHLKNVPIYITIDLDWFDPSVMPGTGTPEPGGFYWQDFSKIIHLLKNYNVIGGDIVELSPQLDNSGISNILAAKVTRSLIMLLSK